jgi:ribonuclease J
MNNKQKRQTLDSTKTSNQIFTKNPSALAKAIQRSQGDVDKLLKQYARASQTPVQTVQVVTNISKKLKISFLGGLADVGEKNMAIIEYGNDAIVLDCGNNLGISLPGVNYEINDVAYLKHIKHKIRAYVITHGHLDHMGGLKHVVPMFPAPIYASRFTAGVIEKAFTNDAGLEGESFQPKLVVANLESHAAHIIGQFSVEFIRITHSIPDASAIAISTPVGCIVATGDFRLDPEPLDNMPSDVTRLHELGQKGVLLLLSDSSYADVEGRVPTESTLQQSFYDIIDGAKGRIFVAAFSSNMNRAQMIINAAVAAGRHVILDGRGMMNYAEIAVAQGVLKVPKGTIVPITQSRIIADDKLLVMCTGGQGEPNAALQRMADGEHRFITLHAGDSVVVSSSPIPGNEVHYDELGNKLSKLGVHLFRHPTHELDGCGPLHVSGHARRSELREMIQLTRPKFFIPVHGGNLRRTYHAELGVQESMPRKNILLPNNGDCIYLTSETVEQGGQVAHGSVLIDQNGNIVDAASVKDRLLLSQHGTITILLEIDKKSGQLVNDPEISCQGFGQIHVGHEISDLLKTPIRRAVVQRFKKVDSDRFLEEIKDHVLKILYEQSGYTPEIRLYIRVLNHHAFQKGRTAKERPSFVRDGAVQQKRYQDMRARLLK